MLINEMTSCGGVPAITACAPMVIGFNDKPDNKRKKQKKRKLPPADSLIDSITVRGAARTVEYYGGV